MPWFSDLMRRSLLFIPLALLVGCAKPDPLIGAWASTMQMEGKVGEKVLTLKGDGTYALDVRFQGAAKALVIRDVGTWSQPDAGHLSLRIEDTKWTLEGSPAAKQAELDANLAKDMPALRAESAKAPAGVLTWVNDDHFVYKDAHESSEYRRKR